MGEAPSRARLDSRPLKTPFGGQGNSVAGSAASATEAGGGEGRRAAQAVKRPARDNRWQAGRPPYNHPHLWVYHVLHLRHDVLKRHALLRYHVARVGQYGVGQGSIHGWWQAGGSSAGVGRRGRPAARRGRVAARAAGGRPAAAHARVDREKTDGRQGRTLSPAWGTPSAATHTTQALHARPLRAPTWLRHSMRWSCSS